MAESIIAWTDYTANFWMGCEKVSPGCANCYAETLTRNRMGLDVWGPDRPRQIAKGVWDKVPKWNAAAEKERVAKKVFVGSLMDWAEDRPELVEPRQEMWKLIRNCPWLKFQMLTKRPENIARFLPEDWKSRCGYRNVWLGTSVENQRWLCRVNDLLSVPACVYFVSYEPALGPIDWNAGMSAFGTDLLDWIIYGGESGPGHRPEGEPGDPKAWARATERFCREHDIAFFHKQSAAARTEMGIELDGRIVREYPAFSS